MSKKQSFLEGVATLTIATVIVKIIGAFFKIPLANIIGGVGMSYFSTAYDIFTPLYSIIVSGLGIAMARLIAESTAKRDICEEFAVLKSAKVFFFILGIVCSLLLYFCAMPLVKTIGNKAAYFSVLAIIPSILTSCISSIYRGYYQGKSNMRPTAISQVIEAVTKLFLGLGFAYFVKNKLMEDFYRTGNIFGNVFADEKQAELYTLRFSAAGAILGISISTIIGAVYVYFYYKKDRNKFNCPKIPKSLQRQTSRKLVSVGVPIALSTLVVSLSNLIDLVTVMNCLNIAVERNVDVIYSMYTGGIPNYITAADLPEYLFGSYSGLAHSIAMLIPSFATVLCVTAIPTVSETWEHGNIAKINEIVSMVLRITMIAVVPMGFALYLMSQHVLQFLYPLRVQESIVVSPILSIMGLNAIVISLSASINSVLQAIKREKTPLYLMVVGALIKVFINITLISKPEINIQGVPYGSLCCYIAVTLFGLISLQMGTGIKIDFMGIFIKPILCSVVTLGLTGLIYRKIPLANTPKLCVYMVLTALFYVFFVLFFGVIDKSDLNSLKINKNIIKTLEKCHIIR